MHGRMRMIYICSRLYIYVYICSRLWHFPPSYVLQCPAPQHRAGSGGGVLHSEFHDACIVCMSDVALGSSHVKVYSSMQVTGMWMCVNILLVRLTIRMWKSCDAVRLASTVKNRRMVILLVEQEMLVIINRLHTLGICFFEPLPL